MEFRIKKKGINSEKHYNHESLAQAREFTKLLYGEFGDFLKAVVLFGSSTKKESSNDIDILVVVDDVTHELGEEVAETYRIIVEKMILEIDMKIHLTTLRLTSFWEYVRAGDPVAINVLRDGLALLDTGFFDPLKLLLMEGRIRPTKESVWTHYLKAPVSLQNANGNMLKATLDLYWAVMDASHAALMAIGEMPPSPEMVPLMLQEKLVKKQLLGKEYPAIVTDFYSLMKKINHREVKEITGKEYDILKVKAKKTMNAMKVILDKYDLSK